jgi:F-type H+-transporting ATPase subunit delta
MKTNKQARREARQLLRLCCANGLLDEGRCRQVLQRFLRERPRGCLPVLTEFQRLLKLRHAQHFARIETATPLSPEVSAGVQGRLDQLYGPGLSFSFAHTPALIGGMRIKVGSDVYDGSVQGRLAALEERFS